MRIRSFFAGVAGLSLVAADGMAQQKDNCQSGPGSAFGVLAYQCANCAFKLESTGRPTYTFFAEPVVLETSGGSALVVGDIIEAVNGQPITTGSGANQFTYPRAGANEITVRRGRDRHVIPVAIPAAIADCDRGSSVKPGAGERLQADMEQLGFRLRGNAGGRASPLIIVDGVVVDSGVPSYHFDNSPTGGFGFGLACTPSCTSARGTEGKTSFTYYKYDAYPPIIAVHPGGPADRAGVRVGDVVTKVDGVSVLESAGALRLWSVHRKDSIRLTVLRDGKETEYRLRTP